MVKRAPSPSPFERGQVEGLHEQAEEIFKQAGLTSKFGMRYYNKAKSAIFDIRKDVHMTKLRTIFLEWDQLGNIVFDIGATNFDKDAVEEAYALGGAALIDHMLATLSGKNLLDFCVPAIQGLVNTPSEIQPIAPVLRKAALEFHHGKYLFTIFKPKTKLFPNNQKLESALSQMTLNSISGLLRTISARHQLALRIRGYCIIASYEEIIKNMFETNESRSSARIKAAQATATFLNKLPKELTEEKLNNLFKESAELIARWKNLPLRQDRSVFSI